VHPTHPPFTGYLLTPKPNEKPRIRRPGKGLDAGFFVLSEKLGSGSFIGEPALGLQTGGLRHRTAVAHDHALDRLHEPTAGRTTLVVRVDRGGLQLRALGDGTQGHRRSRHVDFTRVEHLEGVVAEAVRDASCYYGSSWVDAPRSGTFVLSPLLSQGSRLSHDPRC